jgi:SAM-dependent methyltransferase
MLELIRERLRLMLQPFRRVRNRLKERWFLRQQLSRLPARLRPDADYQRYLMEQLECAARRRDLVKKGRTELLVERLMTVLPEDRRGSVLSLGCRNAHEIAVLRQAGFTEVIGIDLLSVDSQVVPMDMHALQFGERRFDAFFACHSFEHAYDPALLLTELRRVAREGAVVAIEVPVRFRKWKGRADVHDFESLAGLQRVCAPVTDRVLFAEEAVNDQNVVRLVFSMACERWDSNPHSLSATGS